MQPPKKNLPPKSFGKCIAEWGWKWRWGGRGRAWLEQTTETNEEKRRIEKNLAHFFCSSDLPPSLSDVLLFCDMPLCVCERERDICLCVWVWYTPLCVCVIYASVCVWYTRVCVCVWYTPLCVCVCDICLCVCVCDICLCVCVCVWYMPLCVCVCVWYMPVCVCDRHFCVCGFCQWDTSVFVGFVNAYISIMFKRCWGVTWLLCGMEQTVSVQVWKCTGLAWLLCGTEQTVSKQVWKCTGLASTGGPFPTWNWKRSGVCRVLLHWNRVKVSQRCS